MDVDSSAVERFVAESGLQGKKIKPVFITMGSISVTQGMCTEPGIHAKLLLAFQDGILKPLLIHGIAEIRLLGKQPGIRLSVAWAGIPIVPDLLADTCGNGDKTV